MSAYIHYKIIDTLDIISSFENKYNKKHHKYNQYIIPQDFLQYTNYCANYTYYKCDECGIQLLSGIEEKISNYKEVSSERYFLNNKIIEIKDFEDLTCDEVVIKLAIE